MLKSLQHIDVVRFGRNLGLMYFLISLPILVLIGLIMVPFMAFMPQNDSGLGAGIGIAMIIIMPIMYGGFAFLLGLLTAWIYNFIARKWGGFIYESREMEEYADYSDQPTL